MLLVARRSVNLVTNFTCRETTLVLRSTVLHLFDSSLAKAPRQILMKNGMWPHTKVFVSESTSSRCASDTIFSGNRMLPSVYANDILLFKQYQKRIET